MTHIQQLNSSFISILFDPFNQEAWADFDLACIYLNKEGYTFLQHENDFNCPYKTINFSRKQQRNFINIEKKRALDLQFFDYLQQLLIYKKEVLSKWRKVKRKIKIYDTDYFIVKGREIHFSLSGYPLINLKMMAIIKRRCNLLTKLPINHL